MKRNYSSSLLSEYIDYTEPGENYYLSSSMGSVISVYSSVGPYYTYGLTPQYSVSEYPDLLWVVLLYTDVY